MPILLGPLIDEEPPIVSTAPVPATIGNITGLGCYSISAEPKETRCISTVLDFSISGSVEIILTEIIQRHYIDKVQTLYVDNKEGTVDIDFVTDIVGQRITMPAGCQGFIPVLVGSNVNKITAISVGNTQVKIQMLNIFVPTNIVKVAT